MNSRAETIFDVVGRGAVHPFPARMAPGIALKTITSTGRRGLRVLDPMAGSGTVLAVARSQGHRAVGVDLDPLAVLLSRVWTTPVDKRVVQKSSERVLVQAKQQFSRMRTKSAYPKNADETTKKFIRYWFDGYSRRQLSALANAISRVRSKSTKAVLWCAFSRLIITKQSGASLALDLSHSRPHKAFTRAPSKPFPNFLCSVQRVLDSVIDATGSDRGPAARIYEADARKLPLKADSIDLVLTSPPYLNAIDYIRCSKFSLVWMGYKINELGKVRGKSVGAESGDSARYMNHDAKKIIKKLRLTDALPMRFQAILARYIHDMRLAMSEAARVLVPNGRAVFVIGENTVRGTYIKTASILCEIARLIGLKLVSRKARDLPANRRYLPPPRNMTGDQIGFRMRREIILSFRKPSRMGSRV